MESGAIDRTFVQMNCTCRVVPKRSGGTPSVPHITFEVDDLEAAIQGKQILTEPNSPSEGVLVAMILDSGAPVELLQFPRSGFLNLPPFTWEMPESA